MRRRRHGAFATFAMLIPMFAIPVMAVFGIPQFAPVVASPAEEKQPDWLADTGFSRIGHSDAYPSRPLSIPSAAAEPLDLFQPVDDTAHPTSPDTRKPATSESWNDPVHAAAASAASTQPPARNPTLSLLEPVGRETDDEIQRVSASTTKTPRATSGVSTSHRNRTRPSVPPTGPSWRGAVERLNQLGIRTYRLSPAASEGRYHFMCLVTSADDPRISRRFEAESHEPLDAVGRVLTQVEEWNRIR